MNVIGHGSKHRKSFEEKEGYVANYLDTYFYPYISTTFERNKDTETQKKGIDLSLTGATTSITIDEKATTEWVGVHLNKASFELTLLTRNEYGYEHEIPGWYLSDTINSHYELVWIDAATTCDDRYLTGSGITDCTCCILDKKNVQKELDRLGWTKDRLKKKADMVREAFNKYGEDYDKHVNLGDLYRDGVHFFIQIKQPEHAVNIQLRRDKLVSISDYTARINNNKITRLK